MIPATYALGALLAVAPTLLLACTPRVEPTKGSQTTAVTADGAPSTAEVLSELVTATEYLVGTWHADTRAMRLEGASLEEEHVMRGLMSATVMHLTLHADGTSMSHIEAMGRVEDERARWRVTAVDGDVYTVHVDDGVRPGGEVRTATRVDANTMTLSHRGEHSTLVMPMRRQ